MSKYAIKSKLNRQLAIETCTNATADNVFVLPPYSVRYRLFTDDEYKYVRSIYGKDLIIRRTG